MILKFIGKDGSMGLKKNSIHDVTIRARHEIPPVIWVSWESNSCPYASLAALTANWADAEEKKK